MHVRRSGWSAGGYQRKWTWRAALELVFEDTDTCGSQLLADLGRERGGMACLRQLFLPSSFSSPSSPLPPLLSPFPSLPSPSPPSLPFLSPPFPSLPLPSLWCACEWSCPENAFKSS